MFGQDGELHVRFSAYRQGYFACQPEARPAIWNPDQVITEAIPRKEHAPRREVHDPERKHSSQPVDEPLAPLLVAVEQHFAVGMIGHEAMAVTGELVVATGGAGRAVYY